MAAIGITVLKRNVPWGPFTLEQIMEGLQRGDFTVAYLACAPGLTEWLPLGEVLDYVERQAGIAVPNLPPVPAARDLPPVPAAPPRVEAAPVVIPVAAPARPPELPVAHAKPQAPPVLPVAEREIQPEPAPHREPMETASFFPRAIAFLVDCGVIFLPLVLLFVLGLLTIEVPTWFHKVNAQTVSEEWAVLWLNAWRMATWLIVGCGWLYGAWWESSSRGATIGKRWMGLRVVDEEDERVSFLRASGRYAGKYLSALPCFLGFMLALFSSRGQALHDRLAHTRVVRA